MKTDVNKPSKEEAKKLRKKKLFLVGILSATDERAGDPDP
jgi:hypothetical protein